MSMFRIRKLTKSHNHEYFYTLENVVHEVYRTIRGLRFMAVVEIDDYPDKDKLCEVDILLIDTELANKK